MRPQEPGSLADRQAVIDTLVRMLDAADRKDWPAARDQFLDRVHLDHGSDTGGTDLTAADDVIASWAQAFARFDVTWHSISNPLVQVDGDQAVMRSLVHALHADFAAQHGENHLTEWGTYTHEFVRTTAGWRISSITYRCLYASGNPNIFPRG